jgi:hypothetical protein
MRDKWIKGLWLLAGIFTALFLGRWAVLYEESKKADIYVPPPVYQPAVITSQVEQAAPKEGDGESETEASYTSSSIAFHNYAKEPVLGQGAAPVGAGKAAEQTYEKVAALAARTRDFDSDEKKVQEAIQANQALVQQEENTGLKGSRLWNLTLGVVPDRFDGMVDTLKATGELASFQVTKTDKTNDHLALVAKRASLEKNMADLVALKSAGGKIADLLKLQEKIFNLEKQIGDLGIEIGQFEGATGLCTVLLTLKEIGPGPSPLALGFRALDWAAGTCLTLLTWLFFLSLAWLFFLWLVGKAKSIHEDTVRGSDTNKGFWSFFATPGAKGGKSRRK